jgi:hypothetical protein
MTAWQNLPIRPGPEDHFVQLYCDEDDLARNVVDYLADGAERGDGMIVVATPAHLDLFTSQARKAGIDVEALRQSGNLLTLDARATLSSLLVNGVIDPFRFESLVARRVRLLRARPGAAGFRAYGEMVDLLWREGKKDAAVRLEELWNRLLETERIGLFCAYQMDVLDDHGPALRQVLCNHSHLLPTGDADVLGRALDRAMGEVLGSAKAAALLPLIRANHFPRVRVPQAEAAVLWLRHNLPPFADEVLSRARAYYREGCAS